MSRSARIKLLAATSVSAVLALGALSSPTEAQNYETTFAYFSAIQAYQAPAAQAFKDYVEVATGGDIVVNVTTVEALGGDERDVLDQLRLGELQFMTPNAGGLAGVFPSAQTWNLPFLFENRPVAWSLFQDRDYIRTVNEHLLRESNGQVGFLGAGENSVRHLYTTRGPIRVPGDLQEHGIKIRTMQAPMHQDVWAELGAASIVALPAAERYTALQTGLIDATEGGLNSAWNAGLMEVSDYVSLTAHMYDVTSYIVNAEFYEGLPEGYQRVIDEAALLATTVQNGFALVEDNKALNTMIEAGKQVYEPSAEEVRQWQALAEPVGESFIADVADADFVAATRDAIDRIREDLYGAQ